MAVRLTSAADATPRRLTHDPAVALTKVTHKASGTKVKLTHDPAAAAIRLSGTGS